MFNYAKIDLQTPKRSNQKDFEENAPIFKYNRKRIETTFSQLTDHLLMKRNYAKRFLGLSTRTISKITAVTVLQYTNYLNQKPLNHIKHALAG